MNVVQGFLNNKMIYESTLYAALIGLLFRQLEVLIIRPDAGWSTFWHPAVWLGYALVAAVFYLLFLMLLRLIAKRYSFYFKWRMALFLTGLLFIWLSLSANVELIVLHGREVLRTSDWIINLGINLLVLSVPFAIVSIVIFHLMSKREKKDLYNFRLTKRMKVVISSLLIIISAESLIATFFISTFNENSEKKRYNVIMISVDTLRKDHLSLYGYTRKTSPNIDRFFSQGVSFERCITAVPETGPSYTTIYTSTYPFEHKVYTNEHTFRQEANHIRTLAQELGNNGYYCSSHLTGSLPGTLLNLDLGIDDLYQRGIKMVSSGGYDLLSVINNIIAYIVTIKDRKDMNQHLGPETIRAVKWLTSGPREPFYTHIYWHWPHLPYGDRFVNTPNGFKQVVNYEPFCSSSISQMKLIRHNRSQYDADIYYTDIQIGAVLEAIEKGGFLERSVLILTADHGEDLGELFAGKKPFFGHGSWLYESSAHVPLLFRFPGKELSNRKVKFPVSLTDIHPSVLTLLNLSSSNPGAIQGMPLFAGSLGNLRIREELTSSRPYVYSFRFSSERTGKKETEALSAIFSEKYTLHRIESTAEVELYDINKDYHSTQNLIGEYPEIADTLQKELDEWLKKHNYYNFHVQKSIQKREPIQERVLEKLRSLGYVD